MGVAAIAVAWAAGWLAVRMLDPARGLRPGWLARLYEAALGAGAGVAIHGAAFFVIRMAGLTGRGFAMAADIAILAAMAALYSRRRVTGETPVAGEAPKWRWSRLLAIGLGVAALVTVGMQASTIKASPFGEWDAFAIWNLRARFMAASGDAWLHAFSPLLEETHPEYPPLLSAFVARAWVWSGSSGSPVEPLSAAMVLFWAAFALLVSSVAVLRSPASGLFAGFVLLATGSYLRQSTWQYADIPLGFFFLAALSLLAVAEAGGRRTPALLLSGGFASTAALIKDEGLPFLLLAVISYLAVVWRRDGRENAAGRMRWLALGALPGVILLAVFKLFIAPDIGGVLRGQTAGQVFEKLAEPLRYGLILEGWFSRFVALGSGISHPVVLMLILAAVLRFSFPERFKTPVAAAALTTALMALAYWGVYLVTPDDLSWRIDTSLHRLYTQIWPSILFVFFMVLRVPEDPPAPLEPAVKSSKKSKRKRRV